MSTVVLPGVDRRPFIDTNRINYDHHNDDTADIPSTAPFFPDEQNPIDEGYAGEDDDFDDDEQPMLPSIDSLGKHRNDTAIRGQSLTLKILFLTLCLAGLQFTWSVEMAYGTPYLLSLGLSKSHMSLVWIAGPLSGLIMQPIAGAFSDKCTSRWGRRRPFIVAGSLMVIGSLLVIGWTREITGLFVDDSDTVTFKKLSIGIAITSIYVLDFSINCVQASCRALIVDSLAPSQQEKGTAWAGRMLGMGNVLGYFMGYVDLVKFFPFLGNTQLKVLCVFASIVLLMCDAITCYTVNEKILTKNTQSKSTTSPLKTFKDIAANLWNLPLTIRQICNVQFFAWIGWFPFLFYSTTWVAEIYDKTALQHQPTGNQNGSGDTVGQATRAGSLAFLVYSIVSLVASFFIPLLVKSSHYDYDDGQSAKVEFSIHGKRYTFSPGKYAHRLRCLTLPRMWTISHFIFCFAMLSTFFVSDVIAASLVIGICGLSWAVTMWAPFSLLGEYISQCEQQQDQDQNHHRLGTHHQARTSRISLSAGGAGIGASGGIYQLVEEDATHVDGQDDYIQMESYASKNDGSGNQQHQDQSHIVPIEQPTSNPSSPSVDNAEPASLPSTAIPSAGIILGIHNAYVVLPQFLVTFFSSVLFHFLEKDNGDGQPDQQGESSSDAIGVVLRFGAVMAAVAGLLSLKISSGHGSIR